MTRRRRTIDPNKYRVLGVDPSLNGTGICSPDGTCYHLTLNTNKSNMVKGMSRVVRVTKFVQEMMTIWEPTHVCMEGYAIRAKGRTHDKAELHSVIKLLALSCGLPIILVPPTLLKKWVAGHGFAQKEDMVARVNKEWSVNISNDDEADAYGLMRFGLAYLDRSLFYDDLYRSGDVLDKADYLIATKELQTIAINC